MKARNLHLVAYDIANAKRLRRVLYTVKDFAIGGQKSVYECFLSPGELAELYANLEQIIEKDMDRIAIIRMDPRQHIEVLGIGRAPSDPPFFYYG